LLWASPLGWAENLRPLTGSHWFPLVPIALLALIAVGAAALLAAARDLGASALPDRDAPPSRYALLNGQVGLTLRLVRPLLTGWTLALAALGVVFGLVAQSAAKVVTGSKTITDMLSRIGGSRIGAAAYIGFAFLFAAALVAFAAAGQLGALRTEEADGYLDNLLVRPVARTRWLAGRLLVAVALVTLASVVVGIAAWAGAATQHTGIAFSELLAAGINVLPPALFVLGLGTVAYAIAPRRAPAVGYVIVTWSFLVELVASLVTSNRILLGSSLLHYVTPAPAAPPDWRAAGVVAALGVAGMVLGVIGFDRRDLVSA
jgi:ABC-2 type transport system permease protein